MIRNHNIKRYWKNQYLAAHDFSGVRLVGSSLTALTLNEAAPPTLNTSTIVSSLYSAVNTNIVENINSLGLSGVKMNTAGDVIRHYWMPPVDIDYTQPVYARVHWTSGSSDTADTVLWKLWRKLRSPNNDALTATIDNPLDTVIAQDTVPAAVAYTIGVTASGKIQPAGAVVTSGTNGVTTSASATSHTFTSAGATFSATGVHAGDYITLNGTQYVVVSASTTTLVFEKSDGSSFNPGAVTGISYVITRAGISPFDVYELALEMDTKDTDMSEDLYALGVEFLYVPMIGSETCAINTPDLPTGWA